VGPEQIRETLASLLARARSRSYQSSSPQESLAADSRTERVNSGGKSPIPSRPDFNKLRAPANKLHYQLRFSRPSCDPLGVYSCRAPILQIRETVRQLMLEPHRYRGEESLSRHGSRWPKTLRSELNPSQQITVVSMQKGSTGSRGGSILNGDFSPYLCHLRGSVSCRSPALSQPRCR
jgi:hypothetical protein